jgi:hypothetical protein
MPKDALPNGGALDSAPAGGRGYRRCRPNSTVGRRPIRAAGSTTCSTSLRHESALLYPRLSREELGGRFLGPMANLNPKGAVNNSMSEK